MSYFFEVMLSTAFGLMTAIVSLVVFHYIIAPSVQFTQDIRLVKRRNTGQNSYSIKIKKSGFIDLIDTQIKCMIWIKDNNKLGSNSQRGFPIPTTFPNSLFMDRDIRVVELKLFESDLLYKKTSCVIKSHVEEHLPQFGLRFEDIFLTFENVFIRVYVIGHDRFTGIKKLYISPDYYLYNIREGRWSKNSKMKLDIEYIDC